MTIGIGASALSQLVCFALCFAFGLAGGVLALLYLRKASFFERLLTDLFATLCIGGCFIACLKVAMGGSITLYGAVGFILGTISLPLCVHKIKKRKSAKSDE